MIRVHIPSFKNITIDYAVFDYNGTLAKDGIVSMKVKEKLEQLRSQVEVYVITADTYGNAKENLKDTEVKLYRVSQENGVQDKVNFIKKLGPEKCIAIGNGNNDAWMLKAASVGMCVIGDEGCSTKALIESDVVVKHIEDAIDLLLKPNRLKATLRG